MPAMLPRQDSPIAESGGRASNPFYAFLQDLEREVRAASNTEQAGQIAAIATAMGSPDGTVGNIPEQSRGAGVVQGLRSIHSMGLLSDGTVWLSLRNDADAPGNTYVYGTNATGVKGWVPVSDALAQGEGLTLTVGDDGITTFSLAELADSGAGTFKLLTRDTYGRLSGTKDGTTSDVPEGTNLYFTDERADARITAQKGQPNGLATLDAGSKLDPGQLPALAITDTFVVADEAAMLALVCEQGDVAVRIDISTSYILTAEPASTLANWQELLSPTAGAVTSFNGRTGSVTPASGDYTAAQVGADPAGTAAAIVAATITDGDTTHAPSGDAVFDALAGKFDKAGGTISGASAGVFIDRTGADPYLILRWEGVVGSGGQIRGVNGPGITFLSYSGVEWGRWDGPDFKVTGGRLYGTALHNNAAALSGSANQYVGSGTYTPTITGLLNIDASTAVGQAQWIRVGNVVTVSVALNIDVAAASTPSQIAISLPLASNLSGFNQCAGTASSGSQAALGGAISGDATNDRAVLNWISGSGTAALNWSAQFTYLVQ